jgi:hypothetical protein
VVSTPKIAVTPWSIILLQKLSWSRTTLPFTESEVSSLYSQYPVMVSYQPAESSLHPHKFFH